jgi:ligand-binding SRPBCC domain-containing protein
MKYQHRFRVNASLDNVAEFHRRSASMAAITPPPIFVRVHRASAILADGDEMDFTMWFGPLPLRWLARIEATSPEGFTDRQLKGPFAEWVHSHKFIKIDDETTEVLDEIQIRLRIHPLWFPIGLGMWLGLPILFAFREWKTKRILK